MYYDTFTRSDQSGLGTATDSETWTVDSGSSTYSIASNEGVVTGSSGVNYLHLGSNTSADGELLVRLSLSVLQSIAGVCFRKSTSGPAADYTCFIEGDGDNAVTLNFHYDASGSSNVFASCSVDVSVDTYYWLRVHAEGSALSAKFWADGTDEPVDWTLTTTDSTVTSAGWFGLVVYAPSSNIVKFDHFSFKPLPQSSQTMYLVTYWVDATTRTVNFFGSLDQAYTAFNQLKSLPEETYVQILSFDTSEVNSWGIQPS